MLSSHIFGNFPANLLSACHFSFAITTPQPAVTPDGAQVGGTTVEDMQNDNSQHCESVVACHFLLSVVCCDPL